METEFNIQLVSVRETPLTAEFLEQQNFNKNDITWNITTTEDPLVIIAGKDCYFSGHISTVPKLESALELCGIKHKMIYK